MTIDEFCREQHVSKRTVYGRLKERGVEPSSLRDSRRQLTSEGLSILGSLFDCVSTRETGNGAENKQDTVAAVKENTVKTERNTMETEENTERIRELETRIHELDKENAVLKAQKEGMELLIDQLKKDLDAANVQRDIAQQAAQQMQQRLLPESVERGRGGWFARIFGKK